MSRPFFGEALLRDLQLGLPRTPYLFKIQKLAVVTGISGVRRFANAQAKLARWFEDARIRAR